MGSKNEVRYYNVTCETTHTSLLFFQERSSMIDSPRKRSSNLVRFAISVGMETRVFRSERTVLEADVNVCVLLYNSKYTLHAIGYIWSHELTQVNRLQAPEVHDLFRKGSKGISI